MPDLTMSDLDALRYAIRTRDRVVAEIVRRAHAAGLPMSVEQARITYDMTREGHSMSTNWDRLHDGQSYKIWRTDEGLIDWLLMRYTVTRPDGTVVGCVGTRWGAHRVIRRDRRRGSTRRWWDGVPVEESPR